MVPVLTFAIGSLTSMWTTSTLEESSSSVLCIGIFRYVNVTETRRVDFLAPSSLRRLGHL